MEAKQKAVKKCIGGVFLIGMAVQIVFGLGFIGANLFSLQGFSESRELVEMSANLRPDEYTGILYLLIIRMGMMLGKILPLPYFFWLYLLQLGAAFYAVCIFLKYSGLGEEKSEPLLFLLKAGYLFCIPQVLQLHLAVLPQSLLVSFFLIALAVVLGQIRGVQSRGKKDLILVCVCWLAMGLLHPDYLWLGSVPVIFLFCLLWKRKSFKPAWQLAFAALAAVLLINGVNMATQEAGSRGKIQRTLGAALVSRMAWPYFEDNYYFWPEEVKEVMSPEEGREISRYADNVKLVLGPEFEAAFGKKQANIYYWQMALHCFSDRTKEVLSKIGEDFAAYLFVPFATAKQLAGGGLSYAGWNFDRMWEQAKTWTSLYVRYAARSLPTGILFVIFGFLFGKKGRNGKKGEKLESSISPEKGSSPAGAVLPLFLACILTQAVWYTLSGAGMMDYKNVPVVMTLWYVCPVWGFGKYYWEEASGNGGEKC